ncbi:MAG: acyl-CoA synthetase [Bacillota bacterium]
MLDYSMRNTNVPDKLNGFSLMIDRWANSEKANNIALVWPDGKYTYAEVALKASAFAKAMISMGLSRGDRVVANVYGGPETVIAYLAMIKVGLVPIPTSMLLGREELGHILADSEARAFLFEEENLASISSLSSLPPLLIQLRGTKSSYPVLTELADQIDTETPTVDTAAEDTAFILYSTGTTGKPKGIIHTQRTIFGIGETMGRYWPGVRQGDIVFHPHELSFSYTWSAGFMAVLYMGSTMISFQGRFNENAFVKYLSCKPTIFCSVPTVYRMLLNELKIDTLGSINKCISAGEPLPADVAKRWYERFGMEILDGIGTSETFLFCGHMAGMQVRYGSMGKPIEGYRVGVLNDEGKPCQDGEVGNLAVGAEHPCVCKDYVNLPGKYELSCREGWFHVGDLAYRDEDGYIWHVSRSDDIIKSRGYFIAPQEIENVLCTHPYVLESGVIGIPDPLLGQKVKAFITLKQGVAFDDLEEFREELREYVGSRIARFKVPKEIDIIEELPKSPTGKLLRRVLRTI